MRKLNIRKNVIMMVIGDYVSGISRYCAINKFIVIWISCN